MPFPSAPDDPFTARLGTAPPPSPFRAADGATPPVLAGRTTQLLAAADLLAGLVDGRSAAVGFHGSAGMGKTALLDHLDTQVTARGGLVVRLTGTDLDAALGELANARDQLLAGTDSQPEPTGPGLASAYQATARAASAAGRPLMVMIDDCNAVTDEVAELAAAHDLTGTDPDATIGLVVSGVHRHAGMAGVPSGLVSHPLGVLQPAETRQALVAAADGNGVELDPEAVSVAVNRSGGIPVAVQAWGEALWQAAHTDGPVDLARVERTAEARLGQYYTRIWSSLTDYDRAYVAAVANEFGGAISAGNAAERAGYESVKAVSPLRAKLIDHGIVASPQRGTIEVAIAGFGRWYSRTRHTSTADSGPSAQARTRLEAPTPARTIAADQTSTYQPRR
nr:ATP-binding protein [Salsipaludibacter albus]